MSLEDSIEQSIVELIHKNPLDASTISDKLGKDISTVSFKLSIMEVR
jgi:predicted transcriptional regulator